MMASKGGQLAMASQEALQNSEDSCVESGSPHALGADETVGSALARRAPALSDSWLLVAGISSLSMALALVLAMLAAVQLGMTDGWNLRLSRKVPLRGSLHSGQRGHRVAPWTNHSADFNLSATGKPTLPEPNELLSKDNLPECERCYTLARWVITTDVHDEPDKYRGLALDSSFEDVQAYMASNGLDEGTCVAACRHVAPTTTSTGHPAFSAPSRATESSTVTTILEATSTATLARPSTSTATSSTTTAAPTSTTAAPSTTTLPPTTKEPPSLDGAALATAMFRVKQALEEDRQAAVVPFKVSLFCFAVMLPWGGEIKLLQAQHKVSANLFGCDAYSIYSSEVIEVAPGVNTTWARKDLHCDVGGEFGTALNTDIFLDIWRKVVAEGTYRNYDWSVKVDPDSVFFPARLREKLAPLAAEAQVNRGMYINNCKFGMHGPLEVVSRLAVDVWVAGIDRCMAHFTRLCSGPCLWGEDMFMDQCLIRVLKPKRVTRSDFLVEDHCDPPHGWRDCKDPSVVAFHPFKQVDLYQRCLWGALLQQ